MAVELDAEARGGAGAGAAGVWSTCGRGALHLAAANGRAHVCRYLIQDLGFPVDAPSSSGETPLLLAATFGHTETAAYLLERGATPRAPDSDGETPLHWAAYNGDRELAMLLLHRGADAGAANPRGTPLHVAAERAHPDVVSILLRQGADVCRLHFSRLCQMSNKVDQFAILQPNKVANGVFTPLISSLVGGSLKCMKLLILAGANVNAGGFSGATLLFIACSRRGTAPFVKCLLDAGADPNALDELGRLPIEIAAVHAETEVVEVLFPVTRRAPKVPDWTVGGIVSYVNSAAYKEWAMIVASSSKDELKQQGYSAFQRKDYDAAILLYSMALKLDDTDAMLYSNRSVCWLRLGVGDEALSDAQACTRLRPDLAEGYYHQRMAFKLLQDYASASDALLKTSNLDQENVDINEALWCLTHSTCSLA
ncbi:hypothetical protein ACQ4PT_041747 [Festuca glaucescens]